MANDRKNNRTKKFFWLLCFVLIVNSCNEISEEYKPELNVFCVLNNKNYYQKVIVDRTYKMDEKEQYDLEDVRVILSGNGLCDTLVQLYDSIGIFITKDTFPVCSGVNYYLEVCAKGLDTLTGTTCTPDSFVILKPQFHDTVSFDDTLVIKKNQDDGLYFISYIYEDTAGVEGIVINAKDRHEVKIPFYEICWFPEGKYLFRISLTDSNFYNYYNYNGDSVPRCGVSYGVGLFGAMWTESLTVFLKTSR